MQNLTSKVVSVSVIAVAGAVVLSGCSGLDEITLREKEKHFATLDAARDGAELAFTLPGWVPGDATDIDLRIKVDAPGSLLRYRSATSPETCTPATLEGTPLLSASWWPQTPKTGLRCGEWNTFVDGSTTYAFTTAARTYSDTEITPEPSPTPTD